MSITIITGPPASGKTWLARQIKNGKNAIEIFGLPMTFARIPKNTDLIIIEGVKAGDMRKIKSFCKQKTITVNIPLKEGYTINMPDLIFVLDNWIDEELKKWSTITNYIITCSNQNLNARVQNSLNHGDGR